jgi:hypothetical protein
MRSRIVIQSVVAIAMAGCVQGGEPAYKPYCRALCDLADTCVPTVDMVPSSPATLRQCQRECMTDPVVVQTRADVLDLASACLSERDCSKETHGAADTLRWARADAANACTADVLGHVDPTSACKKYCDRLVTALDDCGVQQTVAECRDRVCGLQSDAFDGDTCLSLGSDECDALVECVATGLP